ncbi:UDP-N-acetylmuramoyl-L-alanyl-D-glutamate--2,6-diaminopimelate ligase [Nitriliruptoraceae bacterium ZYF776]|nr:UDP-N-acetylmuramoyl-L-alanyl-D-glutamate--2,6-diaminopimelate ligase [Profundirhabdus halotolerans]
MPRARQLGDDVEVLDVTHDSRQVRRGSLFCAVRGASADGHAHAPAAVDDGAVALLVEEQLPLAVPQVLVPSVRAAMGPAAAVVHGRPSEQLTVVGVTGTNGKTTSAYLLEAAFAAAGWGSGIVGTIATRIHGEVVPGVRTTPEGPDLQRLLRRMHDRGVDAAAIEVSSHGLALHRIDGTRVAVALFTNLTQDHLDFHGTMSDYFAAKARLFTPAFSDRGVVHLDGPWGRRLRDTATIPVVTFGVDDDADHQLRDVVTGVEGGRASVHGPDGHVLEVRTRLPGRFNVANAVGAVLAATSAGVPVEDALLGVAASAGAPGRLEPVDAGQPFTVLVDYAHTPDAVAQVVATLRDLLRPHGRLHVVVGCGGDRDRGKRGPMGRAAAAADVLWLTSDNPRTEDPVAILDAIAAGARAAVADGAPASIHLEVDRRDAIAAALAGAGEDDVVLIAGKGHETGQEFADRTVEFDDRVVAHELLAAGAVDA